MLWRDWRNFGLQLAVVRIQSAIAVALQPQKFIYPVPRMQAAMAECCGIVGFPMSHHTLDAKFYAASLLFLDWVSPLASAVV